MSRTVRNKKYFNQSDFKSKLNQANDLIYGYKLVENCLNKISLSSFFRNSNYFQVDLEDVLEFQNLLNECDINFTEKDFNKLYKKFIYKNFKDVTRETKCDLDRGFEKMEYRKKRRKSNRMYDRNQISEVKKNYQNLDYIDEIVFKVTNQNYYLNYWYEYN